MKKSFPAAKGRHVLILILIILFLAGAGWSQQRWQFYSSPQDKSPGTAQALCLVGTAIPVGLFFAAFGQKDAWDGLGYFLASLGASVVGPAPGYFYGGLWGRGFTGMGLRAIGVVGVLAGIAAMDDEAKSGSLFLVGGVGLIIGSMIYDLASVSGAVRKRNGKMVAISPMYFPLRKAFGIHIQIGFS